MNKLKVRRISISKKIQLVIILVTVLCVASLSGLAYFVMNRFMVDADPEEPADMFEEYDETTDEMMQAFDGKAKEDGS